MFLMRIKPWVHGAFLCTLVMAFHGDVVAVEERPPEQGARCFQEALVPSVLQPNSGETPRWYGRV